MDSILGVLLGPLGSNPKSKLPGSTTLVSRTLVPNFVLPALIVPEIMRLKGVVTSLRLVFIISIDREEISYHTVHYGRGICHFERPDRIFILIGKKRLLPMSTEQLSLWSRRNLFMKPFRDFSSYYLQLKWRRLCLYSYAGLIFSVARSWTFSMAGLRVALQRYNCWPSLMCSVWKKNE